MTTIQLLGRFLMIAAPMKLAAQMAGDELRCKYTNSTTCSIKGCSSNPIKDQYLLVPSLKALAASRSEFRPGQTTAQIRRCDAQGCMAIDVATAHDGAFLDVWGRDGGSYMLKFTILSDSKFFALRRGDFWEVATTFLVSQTFFGHCNFDAPA